MAGIEKKKTGLIVSGFPVSISKLNHKIDIYITLSINKTKYVEYKKLQNKNNNNNDRSISRLEEDIINHYYKTIEIYTTIMEPIKVDKFINLNKYENNEVDVVVISSISTDVPEGIPVSLMEAMSYEIPVIATNCGGTKELVDGESGILVEQNDSEVISVAIAELINEPEYRRKIGMNGRKKIIRDFDTVKNAKDLIKLY